MHREGAGRYPFAVPMETHSTCHRRALELESFHLCSSPEGTLVKQPTCHFAWHHEGGY